MKTDLDACFRHVDARDRVARAVVALEKDLRDVTMDRDHWRNLRDASDAECIRLGSMLRDANESVHSLEQRLRNADHAVSRLIKTVERLTGELKAETDPVVDLTTVDEERMTNLFNSGGKHVESVLTKLRETLVRKFVVNYDFRAAHWVARMGHDALTMLAVAGFNVQTMLGFVTGVPSTRDLTLTYEGDDGVAMTDETKKMLAKQSPGELADLLISGDLVPVSPKDRPRTRNNCVLMTAKEYRDARAESKEG